MAMDNTLADFPFETPISLVDFPASHVGLAEGTLVANGFILPLTSWIISTISPSRIGVMFTKFPTNNQL